MARVVAAAVTGVARVTEVVVTARAVEKAGVARAAGMREAGGWAVSLAMAAAEVTHMAV